MDAEPFVLPGAPVIEVGLLGGFSVSVDGRAVPAAHWRTLRAAHLVQLLALAPRRRLTREQVVERLWPQLEPEAGAANLRKAAHHARRALGRRDAVVLQGGEVQLAPTLAVSIDAAAFEQRARHALAGADAAQCAAVAAACPGDLLPGLPYEDWAEPARERVRALRVELLRAGAQWEALAALEPTDEAAHRELMARDLAAGNRAAAIRWYGRLRAALQRELGVAPAAATDALYRRCIDGLEPSAPALIGREMACGQLIAWLEQPLPQRPSGVMVSGPGGIGKTALCREIAALARARGWAVVTVAAAMPGRSYAAVAAAAESLIVEDRARLDAVGAAARSVLALLTPLAAPAPELAAPPGRHQVIGALRRLLMAAARGGPVMLQIDDAHLLDDADAEAMLHLAAAGGPLMMVLASRPPMPGSTLARGFARLASGERVRSIELAPLHDDELRALLAQQAAADLPAASAQRVVAMAGGNPFVALELARGARNPSARLPANVADAITERLCDVPDAAVELLRWLALTSDEIDVPIAAALAEGGEAQAFAVLDAALRAGVIVVSDARYRFRHELVRQALIDQVPPHRRLKMHRELAARLGGLDVPQSLVARHWLAGGCQREATGWLLGAAHEALRLAAFGDALHCLEPVLAHQRDHAEALRLRAEALDALGDPSAIAAYRLAADVTGGALAHDLRVKGALAQIKQGDPKGGVQALQGLRPSTDDGRLCEALAYSGAAALGAIDPAVGTQKSAEARRLALQAGDAAAIVIASWAHAAAAHARGDLQRSVWADLRDTSQAPHLAARVFDGQLCMVQRFLYGARPYAEVIAFAESLAAEARRLGATRGHAFGVTIRGEAELLSGDLDAAEAHLHEGAALHRAIAAATGEAFALQRLSEVSMYRGQFDEARQRLDQALDLARQSDVGFHLLDRIYGSRIALARDRADLSWTLDDAREAVRGPLETCPGCRITFAVPAAIGAARAGRVELAQQYEGQAAYLANVVMRLPAWYAAHDEVRGHLALAQARADEAVRGHFAAAAAKFRDAGHSLDALRCESTLRWLEGRPAEAPPADYATNIVAGLSR